MAEYSSDHAAWMLYAAILAGLALAVRFAPRRGSAATPREHTDATSRREAPVDCDSRLVDGPRPGPDAYRVAIFLLAVHLGLILLYPWAIALRDLDGRSLLVGVPFLAALGIGIIYGRLRAGPEAD